MTDKFLSSVNIHLWDQPADLGFNDSKSKLAALSNGRKYFFQTRQKAVKGHFGRPLGSSTNGGFPAGGGQIAETFWHKDGYQFRVGRMISAF